MRGIDKSKDQSYFLHQVSGIDLNRALFPLGELSKEQVRSIARDNNLINANKKDSVGICFIGKNNYNDFISNFLGKNPGEIVDENGEKNTFFSPYEVADLDFFLKNITECLTPGGIAVVQPYPYVYTVFDGFEDEKSMLQFYQNPEIGHEYPKSTEHNPNEKLNDYFVVQRDVNRDDEGPLW